MAQRAATGRLDQEPTIHTGRNILGAGGTLRSRCDQAVIATLAPTSEKLFDFLGRLYILFENISWEGGLLVNVKSAPTTHSHADLQPTRQEIRIVTQCTNIISYKGAKGNRENTTKDGKFTLVRPGFLGNG